MVWADGKERCRWANPKNERYIAYHDLEWGVPVRDDDKLFEMLVLETFQAGLSWECVLNKREAFRSAFDGFDAERVSGYGQAKIDELSEDCGIIRNRRKIAAAVVNAGIFMDIQRQFGSFAEYIWHWSGDRVVYETGQTTSALSDAVSADLKRRGMKFVGSTVIYSYLQAIGVIYSHEDKCFLARGGAERA